MKTTQSEKPKEEEVLPQPEAEKPKVEQKPAPVVKADDSNLPDVDEAEPMLPESFQEPAISEYKGRYKNNKDGRVYALAVKEDAPFDRTHFLRNKGFFDNCTKEEFKDRYDKEEKQ